MSTDHEKDRKWDELADRGDLRALMHRIDHRFDRFERLHWIQFIAILCAIALTSLR